MTHNRDLEARINSTLDESVDNLDAATRSRLASARNRALQTQPRAHKGWLPLGGALAASTIAVVLILFASTQPNENRESTIALVDIHDSLELLTGDEDIELYQNLDFYHWLDDIQAADNEQHAG